MHCQSRTFRARWFSFVGGPISRAAVSGWKSGERWSWQGNLKDPVRVQGSLLASAERRALHWLAEHTPQGMNSDHLTLLGFAAQVAAGASYALAHWLGDSLDGTLARVRQRQRPRYGFYVDHMIDSFGAVALMCGLALSGYMHPRIATGLLVAFLLLSIQSYLAAHTLGEFRLSFCSFGPTELRILLAIGNLALFRWPTVWKAHYRLFDIAGIVGLAGMVLILASSTAKNTYKLYCEERLR
jgi:phosphatidylglycerophosphate synthase